MQKNIGSFDGAIRIAIFLALLVNAIFAGTLASWLWVIPGAILFATAALNWCLFYEILGINTLKHGA